MAVGYTAQTTYLANISAGYADLIGKPAKHVLSQFHGTYFIFLQFSQIAGGLISSLLLSAPNRDASGIISAGIAESNLTNLSVPVSDVAPSCGSVYCPSDDKLIERNSEVDAATLLILMGL